MFQLIESRPSASLAAWLCLLAGLLLVPAAGAAPFGVPDETVDPLLAELGERYEILALSRAYAVRPLADAGFELIEVVEDGVLVDGEMRDLDELRDLVGDDAELLLALTGDTGALAVLAERREAERRDEATREIEESIRRQVEELDPDRLRELNEALARKRRQRSRTVSSETRVSLGSSVTIDEDESARDVVVLLGPLDVRGEVRGDSVVVLGAVEVTGELGGDLTVVGGKVSIGPEAVVDGEVICVGGVIHRAPGAIVNGEITEVSFDPLLNIDVPGLDFQGWWPFQRGMDSRGFRFFDFVGSVFFNVLFAAFLLLALLVARRWVASGAERARTEPFKSGLVGFVVEVLVFPILMLAALLLIVSVIGIPVFVLLLFLSPFIILLLILLCYAVSAVALGQTTVRSRIDPWQLSPFVAVLIGFVLIQIWGIFGEGLAMTGGLIAVAGFLLIAFGICLKYLVVTVGLGALVLDRFSPLPSTVPSFVPPPMPEAPEPLSGLAVPPPPLEDFTAVDVPEEDEPDPDEIYKQAGPREPQDPGTDSEPQSDQSDESDESDEDPDEIYKQTGRK